MLTQCPLATLAATHRSEFCSCNATPEELAGDGIVDHDSFIISTQNATDDNKCCIMRICVLRSYYSTAVSSLAGQSFNIMMPRGNFVNHCCGDWFISHTWRHGYCLPVRPAPQLWRSSSSRNRRTSLGSGKCLRVSIGITSAASLFSDVMKVTLANYASVAIPLPAP